MKGQRGMTMIELLVVIAIITLLFSIGVFFSMQAFHNYTRRSERDTIVSVLQRARSRAMANVLQHKWGACWDGTNYKLFFTSYPSSPIDTIEGNTGVTLDTSSGAAFNCANGGIIFDQLTGDTSAATLKVSQGSVVSTITVNQAGRIDW
jgi:prepilin-type N-terminal cleavage/methylation domain-containing protein